eukprot:5900418-Prymnesium_polylepis.1
MQLPVHTIKSVPFIYSCTEWQWGTHTRLGPKTRGSVQWGPLLPGKPPAVLSERRNGTPERTTWRLAVASFSFRIQLSKSKRPGGYRLTTELRVQ